MISSKTTKKIDYYITLTSYRFGKIANYLGTTFLLALTFAILYDNHFFTSPIVTYTMLFNEIKALSIPLQFFSLGLGLILITSFHEHNFDYKKTFELHHKRIIAFGLAASLYFLTNPYPSSEQSEHRVSFYILFGIFLLTSTAYFSQPYVKQYLKSIYNYFKTMDSKTISKWGKVITFMVNLFK